MPDKNQITKSQLALRISYIITIAVSLVITIVCTELIMGTFDEETKALYSAGAWMAIRIFLYMIGFMIMYCALILPVSWKIGNNYSRIFRGYYFGNALNKYFDKVEWDPKKGYDKKFIEGLGIINTGYRFKSDNFFDCTDGKLHFEMADVKVTTYWVQEASKAAGKKKSITNPVVMNNIGYAFHGQWMTLDTNKNCKAGIVIVPNFIGDTNLSATFGGHRVETGMSDFDLKFRVYSDDIREVKEILTEDMLNHIMQFAKTSKSQCYLGFEGNKLYIGVHSIGKGRYLRVTSPFIKINDEEKTAEAERDVQNIKSLLEYMNS